MALFTRTARLLGARAHSVLTKIPARGYADEETDLTLTLAGANKTFYDDYEVKQVDVPSFDGCFGILANHVPTVAILMPGVVTVVEEENEIKRVFVSSGIVTVNDDSSCQVLAEEAHLIKDLDLEAAKEIYRQSETIRDQATTDIAKVEAQIEMDVAEAIIIAIQLYQ